MAGNMRAIRIEADRIAAIDARYHPFAEKLRNMARAYQSQALLKLIEQYLGTRQVTIS